MKDEQELQQLSSDIGMVLVAHFPDEELMLSRIEGSETLIVHAPEHSSTPAEIPLNANNPDELVYEALFSVKQLLQRFDA